MKLRALDTCMKQIDSWFLLLQSFTLKFTDKKQQVLRTWAIFFDGLASVKAGEDGETWLS